MAHSLEVRVPYLDRTVVEFAQRLGAGLMIRNRERKWIHRQVCQHYLPATDSQTQEARLRRERRGRMVQFRLSRAVCRRCCETGTRSCIVCSSRPQWKACSTNTARAMLDNHKLLFSLVMVEQWMRSRLAIDSCVPPSVS